MLNAIDLEAYGSYKRTEYLQHAAHARLFRELRAPAARPARLGRLGSVSLAAAVLLLALRPAAAPVEAAPRVPVTITTAAPALAPSGGSVCWVTGDLIGDLNPAVIAAAFCGH